MRSNLHAVAFSALALVEITNQARASFHTWDVNEIYSNADGSVQFIELTNGNFSSQHVLSATSISISNALGVHTFMFPSNLFTNATRFKTVLLATPGFASLPGGVAPEYTIPTNFLFLNSATINFGGGWDVISYTNLPADGIGALRRTFSPDALVFNATNSPRTFLDRAGSLTDRRLAVSNLNNTDVVFSFNTRTGKTYAIEATDSLSPTNWQAISTNTGTGTTLSVTNSALAPPERFYRLRAQ